MKKIINIVIIIASIIVLLLVGFFTAYKIQMDNLVKEIEDNAITEIVVTENLPTVIENNELLGTLTIPSINLIKAPIKEGTELSILAEAIGHFTSTGITSGNVGLASHNRGSNANYFANIHKLKKGDEIYFEGLYKKRKYLVETVTKIDETDWSYLQETQDNRITLITCVKNEPSKRYCVQAVECNM